MDKKYYKGGLARKVREHYQAKLLNIYEITSIVADGINVSIIRVRLVYDYNGQAIDTIQEFNILYEDETGKPSVRGKEGHNWVIYNSYV